MLQFVSKKQTCPLLSMEQSKGRGAWNMVMQKSLFGSADKCLHNQLTVNQLQKLIF